jgi:hypothetical protein
MTHGSTTHEPGDPVYMLETIVGNVRFFKVFTSESGFKAGVAAADRRIAFTNSFGTTQAGPMFSRKTYVLRNPQWEELP